MTSSRQRVQGLLRESLLSICCNQLTFYSHLQISAHVKVVVDDQDTLSVNINEKVQSLDNQQGTTGDEQNPVDGHHGRNILESSPFRSTQNGDGSESNAAQLIKQEADNSPVGKSWQTGDCQQTADWMAVNGMIPMTSSDAQQHQDEVSGDSTSSKSHSWKQPTVGLRSVPLSDIQQHHLTDNQLLDKTSKINVDNIDVINLPVSYQLPGSEREFKEADQSDVEFSSHEDRKHGGLDPDYIAADPELESEQKHNMTEIGFSDAVVVQKQYNAEDVAMLTVSSQLLKQGGLYKCQQCEFLTEHGSAMNAHIKAHEKTIPCEHCSEMFSSITVLRQHRYDEHGLSCRRKVKRASNRTECKFCKKKYTAVSELSRHLSEMHASECALCPYCDYVCVHVGNLQRHMRTHSISSRWRCKLCDMQFMDKHRLKLHNEQEHMADCSAVCELCGVSTKGPLMLKLHVKTAHSRHQCLGCDFSTPTLETFEKHQCAMDREKLRCKICRRDDFVCLAQLRKHTRQQHPMDHKRKQCDFCEKVFCSRQGLYTHRKVVHSGEMEGAKQEVFTCHICGKGFPIYKYLKGHLKSHEDTKPYQCPKCHKTFKYHRNFKTHKQGCINPSGYPCPICSKTLKNEYSLKVHINGVHLSEKTGRFPCRKCHMPFSHLPTRTSHEKFCTAGQVAASGV